MGLSHLSKLLDFIRESKENFLGSNDDFFRVLKLSKASAALQNGVYITLHSSATKLFHSGVTTLQMQWSSCIALKSCVTILHCTVE